MEKRETDRKESRFVRSIGPHCFHGDAGAELLSAVRSFFARARGVETGEIGWGIMANKWRAWSPVGGDWRGRGRRVSRRHRDLFFPASLLLFQSFVIEIAIVIMIMIWIWREF